MSQEQRSTISGNVWCKYNTLSQEYKHNTMPRVGQVVCFEDGRRFVFCSTKLSLPISTLVSAPTPIVGVSGAAAQPSGTKVVNVVLAGVVANQLKGGTLNTTVGAYKIKGNSASATVETIANTVFVELYDSLCVELGASDDVSAQAHRNTGVIVATASNDPVGVTAQAIDGTENEAFFWAQTAGAAIVAGTFAVGLALMPTAAGLLLTQTAGFNIVAVSTSAFSADATLVTMKLGQVL